MPDGPGASAPGRLVLCRPFVVKESLMKIRIQTLKPRNPIVAPSRMRRAGRHETSASSFRQQARLALRRELDPLKRSP